MARPRAAKKPSPFRTDLLADEDSGFSILRLSFGSQRDPRRNLEARVACTAGANLFSFKVGGEELLLQPPSLGELREQRAGTPIMFPTPNRVRDAQMQFGGRTFTFPPNSGANFIHGLARRRPWHVGRVGVAPSRAFGEAILDWDSGQPEFAHFPIEHRLIVTFTLRSTGLRIAYRVDNRDGTRLPFGFGLHPYFRIPHARDDVWVQVPLARRMEAEGWLPTGKLVPVAGTAHDLRRPTALTGLDLDDVYFGMTPGKKASFELRDRGLQLALSGSADFTHLVVFTPPGRGFFCVENQTSSTDCHNLFSRGLTKMAHLQVIPPGKKAEGHVDWTVTRLARRLPRPAERP